MTRKQTDAANSKKTEAKNNDQKEKIVTAEEKQQLLENMKETMHDLGRLPGIVMAPIVAFVSAKYENIPEERRQHLQQILEDIRHEGVGGLNKLKDRFQTNVTWPTSTKEDGGKETKKTKKTTSKKPTKKTSAPKKRSTTKKKPTTSRKTTTRSKKSTTKPSNKK